MYHILERNCFLVNAEIELLKSSYTNIDTQGFNPDLFQAIKYKFTVYENPNNDFEIVFFRDEININAANRANLNDLNLSYWTPRMYVIRCTTNNYPVKDKALELEDDFTTVDAFERVQKNNSLKLCYEYETLQDNVWEDSTNYMPQELTDFFQDMLKDKAFCEAFIEQIN